MVSLGSASRLSAYQLAGAVKMRGRGGDEDDGGENISQSSQPSLLAKRPTTYDHTQGKGEKFLINPVKISLLIAFR
jgi:hypothetical protein